MRDTATQIASSGSQLAPALRGAREPIIDRWEELLAAEGDSATPQPQLRAMAQGIIEALPGAVEQGRPVDAPACEILGSPGAEPLLLEHLRAIQALGRAIVLEAPRLLGRAPAAEETAAIMQRLDALARGCVDAYVQGQAQRIRRLGDAQAKVLSYLSHDLRGSLNGVVLMMEVLRRELEPHAQFAESVEDLSLIRRSILEAVGTMEKLLYAERLTRGKIPVKLADVDLGRIAASLEGQFAARARERGVTLALELPQATIKTDLDMLTLALHNLLDNALRYTQRGAVRLSAESQSASGGVEWTFAVSDTGAGIEEQKLRGWIDGTAVPEPGGKAGSGLGLVVVRQVAQLLNGRLTAESKVGEGSTFRLSVPGA